MDVVDGEDGSKTYGYASLEGLRIEDMVGLVFVVL